MKKETEILNLIEQMNSLFNNIINAVKKDVLYYESAMKQLNTYIEIMEDEFATLYEISPINHVFTRIKTPESIAEKIKRKKLPLNIDGIESLSDIVGARIICDFVDNIYTVIDSIKNNQNIKVIKEKDYITNPKESGYRGYHMIIEIPISIGGILKNIKAEIQIRTLAMDLWAENEHKLNYKKKLINDSTKQKLKENADIIWNVDLSMNDLFKKNRKKMSHIDKLSLF